MKKNNWCGSTGKVFEEIEAFHEQYNCCGRLFNSPGAHIRKCKRFPALDIEDLIERIEKKSYEDIRRHLKGVGKFSEAIEVFNEANNDLVSYLPDKNKMLKINTSERR